MRRGLQLSSQRKNFQQSCLKNVPRPISCHDTGKIQYLYPKWAPCWASFVTSNQLLRVRQPLRAIPVYSKVVVTVMILQSLPRLMAKKTFGLWTRLSMQPPKYMSYTNSLHSWFEKKVPPLPPHRLAYHMPHQLRRWGDNMLRLKPKELSPNYIRWLRTCSYNNACHVLNLALIYHTIPPHPHRRNPNKYYCLLGVIYLSMKNVAWCIGAWRTHMRACTNYLIHRNNTSFKHFVF